MKRDERIQWFTDSLGLKKINTKNGTTNCAHCALRMDNYISQGGTEGDVTPVPTRCAKLFTHPTLDNNQIKRSYTEDPRVFDRVKLRSVNSETVIVHEIREEDGVTVLDLTLEENERQTQSRVRLIRAEKEVTLAQQLKGALRRQKDGTAYGLVWLTHTNLNVGHVINYFVDSSENNDEVYFIDAQLGKVVGDSYFADYHDDIFYLPSLPPEGHVLKQEPALRVLVKSEETHVTKTEDDSFVDKIVEAVQARNENTLEKLSKEKPLTISNKNGFNAMQILARYNKPLALEDCRWLANKSPLTLSDAIIVANQMGHIDLLRELKSEIESPNAIDSAQIAKTADPKQQAAASKKRKHSLNIKDSSTKKRKLSSSSSSSSQSSSSLKRVRNEESRANLPRKKVKKTPSLDNSLKELNIKLTRKPNDFFALVNRSEVYRLQRKRDEALVDLNKALELSPDNIFALAIRGTVHLFQGKLDEALVDLNKALELSPDNILALTSRGGLYWLQVKLDEALVDSNKALELSPDNILALTTRGGLYRQQDKLDEALVDLNNVLELSPDNTVALTVRGEVYRQQDKLGEALVDLNKALKLSPDDIVALTVRVMVYRQQGKLDEALVDLNKALELKPNDFSALGKRSSVYRQQGKLDEALADLNNALELKPNDFSALGKRSSVYRQQGKLDEALADLNKVLGLKPNNILALSSRGAVYWRQGNLDEALIDLNKVLGLKPNDIFILNAIRKIYAAKDERVVKEKPSSLSFFKPASHDDSEQVRRLKKIIDEKNAEITKLNSEVTFFKAKLEPASAGGSNSEKKHTSTNTSELN